MAVKAFSDQWATLFKDEVNKSSVYKQAARGWKWGDLPTIVRYTKASQEMTECTTRVPVEWPDEK